MLLNTANLPLLESNPSQYDKDDIGFSFTLGLAFETNDQDGIAEAAFVLSIYTNGLRVFAICRTALALGMSSFKMNSFCNIKFQDNTLAMKKWLVACKGDFGQLNKLQVNIT